MQSSVWCTCAHVRMSYSTDLSHPLVAGLLERRLQWRQASFIHLARAVKILFVCFFRQNILIGNISERSSIYYFIKIKIKKKKRFILIEKCINHAVLSARLVSSHSVIFMHFSCFVWKVAALIFYVSQASQRLEFVAKLQGVNEDIIFSLKKMTYRKHDSIVQTQATSKLAF